MSPVILRLREVRNRVGLSRSAIYDRIKRGAFPAPISLGARAVGWPEADVNSWIENRIQVSRKAAA